MKRTWILIADSSGARILEALGNSRGFFEHAVGDGRYPYRSDSAPQEERPRVTKALDGLFASQLSTMLANRLKSRSFDRLVLVAPTVMLGKLRKMISPAVRETVIAEIEMDLTDVPTSEIAQHLADVTLF
ncbi:MULTISPECIES: host attachment protein [unclassified Hyphomicrobium]|uniref:baeRF12 domain-containing protein n=1 Tax=unclassified Hyphomicrobium TaxID=2619925 RepID=UPI000213EDBC|nr:MULTISPECIES: host attachment protein [unclassified Hyphomicrobium]CCB67244.1 Host attachment protein [Hyphomicrobium sp. MC1]